MRVSSTFQITAAAIFLFALLAASQPAAGNTLATWTDSTANNAWEVPANWDINQFPNNSSYDVRISMTDPCNLSAMFQIGALTVTPNNATLNLLPGSLLAIASSGAISNDGTINVNATSSLRFDATALVTGTGRINIKGGTVSADGVVVTNQSGHTISGFGDMVFTANNAALFNKGTIAASSSLSNAGETLHLFLSNSSSNQNNGVLQAFAFSQPTTLVLEQGKITQIPAGTITASAFSADAVVQIGGAESFTITGGQLQSTDGPPGHGVIKGVAAILDGAMTTYAAYEIPANGFTLVRASSLTNYGTITLTASSSLLRFEASCSLAGAGAGVGAIVLTNDAVVQISNATNPATHVINGSGHTVKGNGTIQIDQGTRLTNNGTISPGTGIGTLNYSGNLELSYASNLLFEIGGPIQGVTYDHLHKIDAAPLILGGKLTVTLTNGFTPAPAETLEIITTQATLGGAFTNVPSGARLNTSNGTGSFVVSYNGNNVVLSDFGPPLPASQLLNISTRAHILGNQNVLIGGFIVTGTQPKKVIVRGIGPSLANLGVPDALPNPYIELHKQAAVSLVASNDDWKDSQQTDIEQTGIPPSNEKESAIVATLDANNSAYTVVLSDKDGANGVGLVEIYDLNPSADSRLANLSSRGFVGTGDDVMIGGVMIGPAGTNAGTVLVRALGPQLAGAGIPGALSDPILELHDPNGNLLAENDNWRDTQETALQFSIRPTYDSESSILVTLAPGNYTAIVRGANNSTGTALIEVYNF